MAKARLYSLKSGISQGEVSKVRGQAKIVLDELSRDNTPRLASAITEYTEKCLKTRQSALRVTLYYIIVFKNKGWIDTREQELSNSDTEETVSEEYDPALSALIDCVIK